MHPGYISANTHGHNAAWQQRAETLRFRGQYQNIGQGHNTSIQVPVDVEDPSSGLEGIRKTLENLWLLFSILLILSILAVLGFIIWNVLQHIDIHNNKHDIKDTVSNCSDCPPGPPGDQGEQGESATIEDCNKTLGSMFIANGTSPSDIVPQTIVIITNNTWVHLEQDICNQLSVQHISFLGNCSFQTENQTDTYKIEVDVSFESLGIEDPEIWVGITIDGADPLLKDSFSSHGSPDESVSYRVTKVLPPFTEVGLAFLNSGNNDDVAIKRLQFVMVGELLCGFAIGGAQGEDGVQGVQGNKGDMGDKGDQGDQGPPGNLTGLEHYGGCWNSFNNTLFSDNVTSLVSGNGTHGEFYRVCVSSCNATDLDGEILWLEGDLVIFDEFVGMWLRTEGVSTVLCDAGFCELTDDLCPIPEPPGDGGGDGDGKRGLDEEEEEEEEGREYYNERGMHERANGDEFSLIRDPGPRNLVIRRPREGLGVDLRERTETLEFSTRTLSKKGNLSPANNLLDGVTWKPLGAIGICYQASPFPCGCNFIGQIKVGDFIPNPVPLISKVKFIRQDDIVHMGLRFLLDMPGEFNEFRFNSANINPMLPACPIVAFTNDNMPLELRQCFSDSDLETLNALNPEGNLNDNLIGTGTMHCNRIDTLNFSPQIDLVHKCATFYTKGRASNQLPFTSNCITWYGDFDPLCHDSFEYRECEVNLLATYEPQCRFAQGGGCFGGGSNIASSSKFPSF